MYKRQPVFSNRRMSLKERERQEDDGSFLGLIGERSLAAAGTDLGLSRGMEREARGRRLSLLASLLG
jgi:hypothetical protein